MSVSAQEAGPQLIFSPLTIFYMSTSQTIVPLGVDRLGCVYNVLTSGYADKDDIGPCVITGLTDAAGTQTIVVDTENNIGYEVPANIKAVAFDQVKATYETGSSVSEMSESLCERVGISASYGGFSASLTEEDDYTATSTISTWYASFFDGKCTMEANFEQSDIDDGTLGLESDFASDLEDTNLDPIAFFERYGTHVICGVRIGGQLHYTCSGQDDVYTTEDDFMADANAKYKSVSGSASVDASYSDDTSTYDEDISTTTNLVIYGGSSAGQAAIGPNGSYDTWIESIVLNPEFMEFRDNGLLPVWELCSNATRAEALKTAYQTYFAYNLTTSGNTLVPGANGSKYNANWYSGLNDTGDCETDLANFAASYKHGEYWSSSRASLVVVGFGATVNNNKHIARALVKTLDLATGDYAYHALGDGSEDTSGYEKWYEVPDGCVITGIGLREHKDNLTNMVVYYQTINPDSADTGYLNIERQTHWEGGALSQYEAAYVPDEYNNLKVVSGIFVNCSSGDGGFDRLVLKLGTLAST